MDVVEVGLLALSVILVIGGGGVGIAAARPAPLRLTDWRDESAGMTTSVIAKADVSVAR